MTLANNLRKQAQRKKDVKAVNRKCVKIISLTAKTFAAARLDLVLEIISREVHRFGSRPVVLGLSQLGTVQRKGFYEDPIVCKAKKEVERKLRRVNSTLSEDLFYFLLSQQITRETAKMLRSTGLFSTVVTDTDTDFYNWYVSEWGFITVTL